MLITYSREQSSKWPNCISLPPHKILKLLKRFRKKACFTQDATFVIILYLKLKKIKKFFNRIKKNICYENIFQEKNGLKSMLFRL